MDNDGTRTVLIILIATSLIVGTFIASLPATILLQGIISDDSFYYFKIAHNVVRGHGFTFDTINPTNGFQPLWQFSLIPIFYAFREPLMLPVRVTLYLQVGLLALSAVLMFRLLRSLQVSSTAGFTVSMVWITFPSIFACVVSGLEGGMYAILLIYTTWYYGEIFRAASTPATFYQKAILGLLLGLTFLARTEAGFFALIVFVDLLALQIRRQKIRSLPELYPVALFSALLAVPYLAWNVFVYGHPVPISGRVKAFLSARQRSALAGQGFIPLVHRLLERWKSTDPIYEIAEIAVKAIRILFGKLGLPSGIGPVLAVLAVMAVIVWILRKPLGRRLPKLWTFTPLVAFAVVTCVYYNVYLFGHQRYWYFIPQMIVSCMLIALFLDSLWERAKTLPSLQRGTGVLVCLLSMAAFAGWLIRLQVTPSFSGTTYPYEYDVARWLSHNTAADARVGVWNAGTVGYFSERAVVNLDGLVNSPAYFQHIKDRTVVRFLEEEGVGYVADYFYRDPFVDSVLTLYDEPDHWRERLLPMLRIPEEVEPGLSQWYIWRFCPSGSCDR
ncbi:MAG: hypothetical protein JXA89_10175 [Anaerolineae bacterium]|nr:hypothetical protein [Anaerolineae bacterium]